MDETKGKNVRVRDGAWHYRFNFRGREYSGPTGLAGDDSNQTAAEEFAAARRRELESVRPVAVAGPPVTVAMTGAAAFSLAAPVFLAWARDVEYRSKPSTAERLRVSFQSLRQFFGDTPVRELEAGPAIEQYKEHRILVHQVRDVTVRHDLHALSVFFRWAVRRGMAARNPLWRRETGIRDVSIPSDREAVREHVVTAAEEAAYFASAAALHALHRKQVAEAQPNMAELARLMLEQGPRPEEVLAARVRALDLAAETLRIEGGKTRAARRTLYLTPASVEILRRRAALGSEWLFPSGRHPGHHLGQLNTTHDRICGHAGVSFTIYDFRHTFATRKIEAGEPVAVVAAIMGHSSLRTIHRYIHPLAEAQRATMQGKRQVG